MGIPKVVYLNGKPRENSWITYMVRRNQQMNNNMVALVGKVGCLHSSVVTKGQIESLGELYKKGIREIDTVSLASYKYKNKTMRRPIWSKSEIVASGEKEVYEIEFEDGRKVLATEEHKFFKQEGNGFKEEIVKNLKVGDSLQSRPEGYIEKYWGDIYKKQVELRKKRFDPRKVCTHCHNLFYVNFRKRRNNYCNTCKEKFGVHGFGRRVIKEEDIKFQNNMWYEWEDNLLRRFYRKGRRELLLELMPHRTWSAINHRAHRLRIKRDWLVSNKKQLFTTKNNPMKDKSIIHKNMKKQSLYRKNGTRSLIEKKVELFLKQNNIPYHYSKLVRTKTYFVFPDFIIEERLKKPLVIECDGAYWHKGRKTIDGKKTRELQKKGMEVLRFGEHRINNNFEEVQRCILQKLNQLKK